MTKKIPKSRNSHKTKAFHASFSQDFWLHKIFFTSLFFATIFNFSQWVHKKLVKTKQKTLTDAEIFAPWLSLMFFMALISALQRNEFSEIKIRRTFMTSQEKLYNSIANWPLLFNFKSFLRFLSAGTSGTEIK